MVDFPHCSGEGVIECECCGGEKTCDECDDGQIAWGELTSPEQRRYFSLTKYEEACAADAAAFAEWYRADLSQLLVRSGYTPWCDLSRRLHFIQPPPPCLAR